MGQVFKVNSKLRMQSEELAPSTRCFLRDKSP